MLHAGIGEGRLGRGTPELHNAWRRLMMPAFHPVPLLNSLRWQLMVRQQAAIWRLGDVFIRCIADDVGRIGLPVGRQWAVRELQNLAKEPIAPRWPRPEALEELARAVRESSDERVVILERKALALTYLRRLKAVIELDGLARRWDYDGYLDQLIAWLRRSPGSEYRQVAIELGLQFMKDMRLEQAKRILKRGTDAPGDQRGPNR